MATCLRPLGILLRNHVSTYYIKSRICADNLIRTHQSLCSDHLKKELHSLCIKSRKDLKVEDLARPACGFILFSRRLAQNGVDANRLEASTEMTEFDALFPEVVEDLTKNEIKNPEIADAFIRLKEVLLYNVPCGKKIRGVSVVTSYKHMVSGASEADLKIARVLGWCVEMDNVGLTAINDSFFLECCIYNLLRMYIRDKHYYLSIMKLFSQSTLQTVIGQCLDMSTAPPEAISDLSLFTMERYNAIVKWKTASNSFYLPVAIAMHMAGISDEESHTKANTILFQMGHLYQVQNDYRDCYGALEVTGKVGSDIEENRCSWLIVKALEIASDEQKEELKLNYGRRDKEAVEKVKAIYRDLKLEDLYKHYKESSYLEITNLINSVDSAVPKAGISDEESHTKANTILFQMGHLYQVQNDYRDCYGALEVTGKVGSDIEENRCSWLIVKALEIASDEQKEELKLNYGRRDKEAVEKVKAIYRDLKLEDLYKHYKESSYLEITNLINSVDSAVPKAGISDEESHTKANTILFQMGHLYQVQNDYRDCYGALEVTGKVGSDIEENRCSWLIVKALEIASDEQKEELKLNYGRRDKEAVEKVKAIYKDLKLEDVYKQYKESSYLEITNVINSVDSAVPKVVFLDVANTIFKDTVYSLNIDRLLFK